MLRKELKEKLFTSYKLRDNLYDIPPENLEQIVNQPVIEYEQISEVYKDLDYELFETLSYFS